MKRILAAALLACLLSPVPAEAGKPHPLLGDTLKTWVHDWGKYAGIWEWLPCPNDNSTDQIQGTVEDGRVFGITTTYCTSATPSAKVRMKMATPYMPTDATYQGMHTYEGTTSRVYFSARLAGETGFRAGQFLPGDFQACGPGWNATMGNSTDTVEGMTKPGIFNLSLDSDGYGTWELRIGTCS